MEIASRSCAWIMTLLHWKGVATVILASGFHHDKGRFFIRTNACALRQAAADSGARRRRAVADRGRTGAVRPRFRPCAAPDSALSPPPRPAPALAARRPAQ
jgi:hypothetical protein